MSEKKIEIGDGLFASCNGYHFRLRQRSGLSERVIHAGPDNAEQLIPHLMQYVARVKGSRIATGAMLSLALDLLTVGMPLDQAKQFIRDHLDHRHGYQKQEAQA